MNHRLTPSEYEALENESAGLEDAFEHCQMILEELEEAGVIGEIYAAAEDLLEMISKRLEGDNEQLAYEARLDDESTARCSEYW